MAKSTKNIETVKTFVKDYVESIEEGKAGEFLGFTPQNLYQIDLVAHGLYTKKRYRKATVVLEGLIELDRHRAYPHLLLGEVLMAQQKYDESLESLMRADELDPQHIAIRLKLGELYLKMGKNELAEQVLMEAIAMEVPESQHLKQSRAKVLLHNLKTRPLTQPDDASTSANAR